MKKKIIIVSAVLVVIAGGFGVTHVVHNRNAAQTSSNHEFFYNDDSNEETAQPTEDSNTQDDTQLPSRDEVVTTPDSIYCLVNKEYSLPSDYEPDDLVIPNIAFSIDYESEKKYIRKKAAEALEQMFADAAKEELELVAVSGYRSYARQEEIYQNNLKTRGTSHTNQYSAKPGYSEHQTGLVMDVSCKSEHYDLQESFGETPEGKWLAENASTYGYVIRYPEGKSEITGYAYEPWHIRYVGVEMATYLTDNNLTLDEYFHYEPSYNFITDESEYINETPTSNSDSYNSATNTTTPAPVTTGNTSSNSNQKTGNTSTSTVPSRTPVASKAPVTTEAVTQAPSESTAAPVENTVSPSEEPPATVLPSTEPSKEPTVAPTTAAPSKAPATVTPPSENAGDVETSPEGSIEEE